MDTDDLLKILHCGDASLDEQVQAANEIEHLHEIGKAVYTNWACGEPIDKDMIELGKALGFEVDTP